jgi:hypothetical protein
MIRGRRGSQKVIFPIQIFKLEDVSRLCLSFSRMRAFEKYFIDIIVGKEDPDLSLLKVTTHEAEYWDQTCTHSFTHSLTPTSDVCLFCLFVVSAVECSNDLLGLKGTKYFFAKASALLKGQRAQEKLEQDVKVHGKVELK